MRLGTWIRGRVRPPWRVQKPWTGYSVRFDRLIAVIVVEESYAFIVMSITAAVILVIFRLCLMSDGAMYIEARARYTRRNYSFCGELRVGKSWRGSGNTLGICTIGTAMSCFRHFEFVRPSAMLRDHKTLRRRSLRRRHSVCGLCKHDLTLERELTVEWSEAVRDADRGGGDSSIEVVRCVKAPRETAAWSHRLACLFETD